MSGSHSQRPSPYDHRDRAPREAYGGQSQEHEINQRGSAWSMNQSLYREQPNSVRGNTTKRIVTYIQNKTDDISNEINNESLEKQSRSQNQLSKHSGPHAMRSNRTETSKLVQAGYREQHHNQNHHRFEKFAYPQNNPQLPTNQWEAYRQMNDQRMGRKTKPKNNRQLEITNFLLDEDCEDVLQSASDKSSDQRTDKQVNETVGEGVNISDLLSIEGTKTLGNKPVTEAEKHQVRCSGYETNKLAVINSSGFPSADNCEDDHFFQKENTHITSKNTFDDQINTDNENVENTHHHMRHTAEHIDYDTKRFDPEIQNNQSELTTRRGKPDRSLKPNIIFSKLKSPFQPHYVEHKQMFDSNEQAKRYSKLYEQNSHQTYSYENNNTSNAYEHGISTDETQWSHELQKRRIERLKESLGIKANITPKDSKIPEDEIINSLNDSYDSYEAYKENSRKQNLRMKQMELIKKNRGSQNATSPDEQMSKTSSFTIDPERDDIQRDGEYDDEYTDLIETKDYPIRENVQSCGLISSLIGKKPTRTMEVTSTDNKLHPGDSSRTIQRIVSFVHNSIKSLTPIESNTKKYTQPLSPSFQTSPTLKCDASVNTGKSPLASESLRCVQDFLLAQDSQQKFAFKSPSCTRQTQTSTEKTLRRSSSRERHTQTYPVDASNDFGSNTNNDGSERPAGLDQNHRMSSRSRSSRQSSAQLSPTPPPRGPRGDIKRLSPPQTVATARHSTGAKTSPPPSNINTINTSTGSAMRNPAATNSNSTTRRKYYRKRSSSKSKTTFI